MGFDDGLGVEHGKIPSASDDFCEGENLKGLFVWEVEASQTCDV